jgi:hypothetical protein
MIVFAYPSLRLNGCADYFLQLDQRSSIHCLLRLDLSQQVFEARCGGWLAFSYWTVHRRVHGQVPRFGIAA